MAVEHSTTSRPISTVSTTSVTLPPTTLPPTTIPPITVLPSTVPPPTTMVATTAPPTTVEPSDVAGCHPSYADVCLPSDASDVDCPSGTGNGPVYAPSSNFQVVGPDVFDLDRDGDGTGCE